MAWVKGPNGHVAHVPDRIVSGLVGDGSRGYEIVPDPSDKPEPEPRPKPATRRSRRKPATK